MTSDGLYIGLMSGTSADGIDAVLVEFTESGFSLHATHNAPFTADFRQSLQQLMLAANCSLTTLGQLHQQLAQHYAAAVNTLITKADVNPQDIIAIGSHGQTVRHEPPSMATTAFSLQLGDPSTLAYLTGINVVADFRQADIAAGGEGAPLAAAFHHYAFGGQAGTAVLNLGGIANLTRLQDPLIAYDTGPASTLMDAWIQRHQNQPYDNNGDWARSGTANTQLLEQLLQHPYFADSPPKSTGFETFNIHWLEQQLAQIGPTIAPVDVQATLLELTVQTVCRDLQGITQLRVCGGGACNGYLLQRLQETSGINVSSTAVAGIAPQWMEACAFAWLARQYCRQQPGNITSVTGAGKPCILGGLYRC